MKTMLFYKTKAVAYSGIPNVGSTCESLAYIRTGWACTKSNVPPLLNAADSSVLGIWDAYVGGNLQSKEGTGASSIEKGHVLFKPAICALSRLIHISEQEEKKNIVQKSWTRE